MSLDLAFSDDIQLKKTGLFSAQVGNVSQIDPLLSENLPSDPIDQDLGYLPVTKLQGKQRK